MPDERSFAFPSNRLGARGGASSLFFVLLAVSLLGLGACDRLLGGGADKGPVSHAISLGGRGAEEHLVPPRLVVSRGDTVHFVTVDGRVHTIAFDSTTMTADAWGFLRDRGQAASPPLINRGSRFVVDFTGAPLGRYPFLSQGHGDPVEGVVVVE